MNPDGPAYWLTSGGTRYTSLGAASWGRSGVGERCYVRPVSTRASPLLHSMEAAALAAGREELGHRVQFGKDPADQNTLS